MTEALFFNSHSGYLEGVLRGFKAGLLTQAQYSNLTQCESLDDFKMQLTATDYGNFLANETPPISTSTIAERATQRMVDEFNYIRSNATGNLKKFLDYMTCVLPLPESHSIDRKISGREKKPQGEEETDFAPIRVHAPTATGTPT